MRAIQQKGFTLVEVLVAMVIGLVVILGSGQLFLATLSTFRQVDELGRKQDAVVFAAHTLAASYRRGEDGYVLGDSTDARTCAIRSQSDGQPVIEGFYRLGVCNDADFKTSPETGLYKFTLQFEREGDDDDIESLVFHVMSRSQALN
ncbi:MAG: prepilin-type N-terminal cleavage/methylation domain-containing protein [Halomonas sp.]|nr:prepilin-type N-terminal cleavage/methylation domain-containing protein [Halomonas sp.]MDP3535341.1 prepilin-type N-terminal cleavage/methylation domain-containing protein [Halomonas sp.]